jgi:hypothetical protein
MEGHEGKHRNPDIVVTSGARVSIELVNSDPDAAQGLVITASGASAVSGNVRPARSVMRCWFAVLCRRPRAGPDGPSGTPEQMSQSACRTSAFRIILILIRVSVTLSTC